MRIGTNGSGMDVAGRVAVLLLLLLCCRVAEAASIRSFSPQGEVAVVRQVRAVFSDPMARLGEARQADPFVVDCGDAPRGRGRWIDERNWVFEFDRPLDAGVRCSARVRGGVRALDGSSLGGSSEFTFSTGGPAIVRSVPAAGAHVDEEQVFLLSLSGAVDPRQVRERAWCEVSGVGERIAVRIVEGVDRERLIARFARNERIVLVLGCARRLPGDAALDLVWGPGITSPGGVATRQRQVLRYKVREPFGASYGCQRDNASAPCSPLGEIRVEFSAPVDRSAAEGVRLLFPDSARSPRHEPGSSVVSSVVFRGPFPESTAFRIEVPAGLRDADGRPLVNAAAFPVQSRTGPFPPLAKFAAAPFGILESHAEPAMPVTLRGVESTTALTALAPGRARLRDLRVQDDAQVMDWYARISLFQRRLVGEDAVREAMGQPPRKRAAGAPEPEVDTRGLSLLGGRAGVGELVLPAPGTGRSGAVAAVPATPATTTPTTSPRTDWPFEVIGIPLPDPGFHVLELQSQRLGSALLEPAAPMYVRTSALVTNLAVHFKKGRENSLVWVTSLDRGLPVAQAEVRISDCGGKPLWQGRTDRDGLARVPGALAGQPGHCDEHRPGYFVSARARDRLGRDDFSFVWSDWNQGIESWRFNVPTEVDRARTVRAHTVFDRTLLRAGETVSMKHLVRLAGADGLSRPVDAELPSAMTIVHVATDQSYAVPLRWRGAASDAAFRLPDSARPGRYEVYLDYGSEPAAQAQGAAPPGATPATPSTPAAAGAAQPGAARRLWDGRLLGGSFRVEAFRLPVFEARIGMPAAPVVAATSIPADVQLSYLSGGPAAKLPVTLSAMLRTWTPRFEGFEEFSFVREDLLHDQSGDSDAEPQEALRAAERLREAGIHRERLVTDKRVATLDTNGAARLDIGPIPPVSVPHRLLTELTYPDPSGEIQTSGSSVMVWPSSQLVGVATRGWATPGKAVSIGAAVVDTAGKPVAGARVHVHASLLRTMTHRKRLVGGFYGYDNVTEARALGEVCSGRTDRRGLIECEVRPALRPGEAGRLLLVAQSADPAGRPATASTSAWVSDRGEMWFEAGNLDRIDLVPERRAYAPGETARLQVRMPFRQATALVSVEREGVLETRVEQLNGRDPVVTVPIGAAHAPNIYVSVLSVRGRLREVPWYSLFVWGWRAPLDWFREWQAAGEAAGQPLAPTATVDLARPAFRLGLTELTVSPEASRLKVGVGTDRSDYPVRGTAAVSIHVLDAAGRPAPAGAEVAVAVVDQALLELQPNRSWRLLEAMMQRRAYGVETSTAQMQVVGKRHFGRKAMAAGGDGGRNPTRELFDTLLYWNPRVTLDAGGRATVSLKLGDALTALRIVAVADAGSGMFGTGEATIRTTQDLQLIGGLSPLAREGDVFEAGFTLRNTTGRSMRVRLELDATAPSAGTDPAVAGPVAATPNPAGLAALRRTLEIPAGGALPIQVPVRVPTGVARIDWQLAASEEGGTAGDRLALKQSVAPAVPRTVRQASLTRLGDTLEVPLGHDPDALPGRSAVRLVLASSIAGSLNGVRDWFLRYPYTCLEQRASRAAGLGDRAAWEAVLAELPAYLDRDGLASYFPAPEGAPASGSDTLTAYLLSLAEAAALPLPREARERMLEGLAAFAEGRIRRDGWSPRPDLTARRLAALAVLARHERASVAMVTALEIAPERLPDAAILDWIALLQRLPALPQQRMRLEHAWQVLRGRLVASGTRLELAGDAGEPMWWLMESRDGTAARLLLEVVDRPEWREDAPRLLSSLLGRMRNGAWGTTTANAWGTLAVRRFAAAHEEAAVTGVTRADLAAAAAGRPSSGAHDWSSQRAEFELAQPDGAATLRMTHRGAGRPWVSIQALAAVPLTEPLASGYRLVRRVEVVERRDPERWSRGDIVRVRLEFEARQPMTWVVIDDPVPAGATVLGSGLGRDSAIASREVQAAARDTRVRPAFVERGQAAARAYFDFLPAGRHEWQYVMRLNQTGVFRLPPSRIEALYAPEIFAETPNPDLEVAR